ncbi:uncharacterized protein LOC127253440 [Andrographis paniculata]|uniref:uncharacterized protein LOC127253440 n=1 Tax=Andrographis paniculata TaxID=175694 RepID=UPI0021E7AEBB|nr:uncharacterized protein LOC127253440 [Andrographis paniculata]
MHTAHISPSHRCERCPLSLLSLSLSPSHLLRFLFLVLSLNLQPRRRPDSLSKNSPDTKGSVNYTHALILMATPPLKSQPLHNFSLPHLRWAHKSSSSTSPAASHHHRFRRAGESPDHHHTEQKEQSPRRNAASSLEDEVKPWNLRPRKEIVRAAPPPPPQNFSGKATADETNDAKLNSSAGNGVKSQRLRGSSGAERRAKRRLWISLSREEIEEDVYALTGGKPARRPRKWPRNVQKQLDSVFPGLYLVGVAADSYRAMMI